MTQVIVIKKDGVTAEVVDRYVGDFLRDGWVKVEEKIDGAPEEKVELHKTKNHGR